MKLLKKLLALIGPKIQPIFEKIKARLPRRDKKPVFLGTHLKRPLITISAALLGLGLASFLFPIVVNLFYESIEWIREPPKWRLPTRELRDL